MSGQYRILFLASVPIKRKTYEMIEKEAKEYGVPMWFIASELIETYCANEMSQGQSTEDITVEK